MTAALVVFFVLSYLLTGIVRKLALTNRLLDVPNDRSSHLMPTPSGGGIAIVACWLAGSILAAIVDVVEWQLLVSVLPPALAIASISLVDDKIGVPAGPRMLVHLLSAGWFIALNQGLPSFELPLLDNAPLAMTAVCVIGLVWLTNLYNFMDGIDGIAGVQAVFFNTAMSGLSFITGAQDVAAMSAILAVSCAGFLIWNWPPARIFMGDTGSSCLGFVMGAMAIYVSMRTDTSVWIWVILLGVFLADATVTLIRRLVSGQRWYEAHRSHAYQILSRRWNSHGRVTLAVALVNVGWLLPMSAGAYLLPEWSPLIAMLALAPLVAVAVALGAGTVASND